ncbi:ornithine aminotransferase, mitochondrial-like [Humulus lupulus]|uniref:ornithine aminotransferase, mitochondrial-like n=1 Tax=Humulus lupulus TaxID=3486 RepID=UPI002B4036B6|nr:ornithine aminotransferase, mitochondrial-like [Humulus lupulus]
MESLPTTMNGPLLPGHLKVDFGDLVALEKAFNENGDRIAGFLFEPIQGEAGVVIPHDGYLKSVKELCSKYNILMIADEIQSGLARSGKLLACDWEEVRPDVVILGKALGGGVIPVSAVLANKDVMLCIRPGEHGSGVDHAEQFTIPVVVGSEANAVNDLINADPAVNKAAYLFTVENLNLHKLSPVSNPRLL